MAVESANSIEELDVTTFDNDSFGYETDDHVNLLKSVLKSQFPGSGGNGFSTPITATETEINYLSGVTSSIQTQLDVAISQRMVTVPSAVGGNIGIFDNNGTVIDSGVSLQSIIDRLDALES